MPWVWLDFQFKYEEVEEQFFTAWQSQLDWIGKFVQYLFLLQKHTGGAFRVISLPCSLVSLLSSQLGLQILREAGEGDISGLPGLATSWFSTWLSEVEISGGTWLLIPWMLIRREGRCLGKSNSMSFVTQQFAWVISWLQDSSSSPALAPIMLRRGLLHLHGFPLVFWSQSLSWKLLFCARTVLGSQPSRWQLWQVG